MAKAHRNVTVCGSVFGTTLGAVCAYLEGRGLPGEKAYVLRSVRTQLLPLAEALRSMSGTDAVFLSRGLASCRVANAQRDCITEPLAKIDSKYGNSYTCLGATAAILACFGVMSTVPEHARHLITDESLVKTLHCAMEQLRHWRTSGVTMADDGWEALGAERRAMWRAADAARLASYVYQDDPPTELLGRQIAWAKLAAFPPNRCLDESMQSAILREIETQVLFNDASLGHERNGIQTHVVETVPLSQIGEGRLLSQRRRKCGEASDASSSWVTLSSNASSFTSVSQGSLDRELVDWWNVDNTIKKERMSNARKALADKLTSSPVLLVKSVPGRFKPTYHLRMTWSFSNEECVEKRTSIDPATCIGSDATYNKIGKCEKLPTCGGVYLMDTSCFGFDWEDCDVEENLYFGNHPFPGYGDRENFNLVEPGDTMEMVAQKLLTYKNIDELIIHDVVWKNLSLTMQEALLRDSLAKEVYICNAAF